MMSSRPEPEDLETDSRLPSGPWTGFYIQWGMRGRQDLGLKFRHGLITGGGRDNGGLFTVRGTYDTEEGRCALSKRYDGYEVEYDGYIDDNGIWGRWTIRYEPAAPDDKGHFHIWPLGDAEAHAERAQAEVPLSASSG